MANSGTKVNDNTSITTTNRNNNINTKPPPYKRAGLFSAHLAALLRLLPLQLRRAQQGKLLRVGHARDELERFC